MRYISHIVKHAIHSLFEIKRSLYEYLIVFIVHNYAHSEIKIKSLKLKRTQSLALRLMNMSTGKC